MSDTTGEQLRQFIERIERMEAEKADAMEAIKEIYAEAKGNGFDVPVMRKVIARRKRDRDDLAEEAAILDTYEAALGAK